MLELVPKGVNKGSGMRKLLANLELPVEVRSPFSVQTYCQQELRLDISFMSLLFACLFQLSLDGMYCVGEKSACSRTVLLTWVNPSGWFHLSMQRSLVAARLGTSHVQTH